MSVYGQDYEPLPKGKIDELLALGYSRYYLHNIKKDIEEAVGTIEVYLRHYVQVPPLAGHLHKVEGMHLVMSLYNKLKEWQQMRKQMRDTFSDECMNEKDCQHALGLWHDIKSKVQEKLNVIMRECPHNINEEVSATQRSAELTKVDFEDYASWCNNISYDPVLNPSVMPFVIHPNLNQSYSIPDPENYYTSDVQIEAEREENVIAKADDYHLLRASSSQLSMADIYEHLLRIIYSLQVCFIGIWQDDVYIKLGNTIPENIGPLSVYRSYTKTLFEMICEDRWQEDVDKMIDEDLKEWCDSKDLIRKKLTDKQRSEFYKYEIDSYRNSIKIDYPSFFKSRNGFFINDSNKVNVALLSHKVYHQKGAEDFIKKCLLIEVLRDIQSKHTDNQSQGKTDSRTSPTYALTDIGKKNEVNAKKCAKEAYVRAWGNGYMNAYLIRALFEKGIIKNLKPTPAIRLLIYWELFGGEVDTLADNINEKINKIKGDNPKLWNVSQVEKDTYNDILNAFEDYFPTPMNG